MLRYEEENKGRDVAGSINSIHEDQVRGIYHRKKKHPASLYNGVVFISNSRNFGSLLLLRRITIWDNCKSSQPPTFSFLLFLHSLRFSILTDQKESLTFSIYPELGFFKDMRGSGKIAAGGDSIMQTTGLSPLRISSLVPFLVDLLIRYAACVLMYSMLCVCGSGISRRWRMPRAQDTPQLCGLCSQQRRSRTQWAR